MSFRYTHEPAGHVSCVVHDDIDVVRKHAAMLAALPDSETFTWEL